MTFNPPLIPATLIKRYKRFLADVMLENNKPLTVHCPNSGSMKSCIQPGWHVMISDSQNPNRKYRYTLEMVHNGTCWIGVNTNRPNAIVEDAILAGNIPELSGYEEIKREVKYSQNSRIDILLKKADQRCYVEVKNVTLVENDGFYKFPDAVTIRGQKHLQDLAQMVAEGHRAVMVYLIQRSDGTLFTPADAIDPEYGKLLREVHQKGVEILPYRAEVTPECIQVVEKIALKL
ncbi:MAG: DNA/RNA nuclease SfsA [Gemmatimonadetes bacterium]|nr:MAG: DNA/RNA nuclease SfsA [Gemmatimonadota bacterium]